MQWPLHFLKKEKLHLQIRYLKPGVWAFIKKDNAYCFAFYTTCRKEYEDGLARLKNSNFFHAETGDSTDQDTLFFQKKNLTVHVSTEVEDDSLVYTFLLKKKELPSSVQFAEDLLNFDSHEYLVSYFGEANVQKDV